MSGCKRCGGNHYVVEAGAKRNCPNCVVEDSDDSVLAEAEELITSDRADVYGTVAS